MDLDLASYQYDVPRELIAQKALKERDRARLFILDRQDGSFTHRHFTDVSDFLLPGDCLVINKTKVIPARIFGKRETGGKVEVLFLSIGDDHAPARKALALIKPFLNIGSTIRFPGGLQASVESKTNRGETVLKLSGNPLKDTLEQFGSMPLPPYIKRERVNENAFRKDDLLNYQTVYSQEKGSIAAPTAGLHFTQDLLDKIKKKGVQVVEVVLHVGWGTFRPVRTQDITQHTMFPEYYAIGEDNLAVIKKCKENRSRVIAVGTTTVRALESVFLTEPPTVSGETSLFIYPGFSFKVVSGMITNFHLPDSTPLLMVSAFAQREVVLKAYREAVQNQYRFYSYGDAMLII